MGNYSRFATDINNLAIVIAFDPGETTGYCVMGVHPDDFRWPRNKPLQDHLKHIEYGEIDCGARHGQTGVGMKRGHAGLNMSGENAGITQMISIVEQFDDKAAIVLEDFIPDPKVFDQARHTLSPVRIIAGFSYGMYIAGFTGERIFIQNRSLHKTTFTDERLKNLGLYDSKSGPHARDATRAAFYFLRDCSRSNPVMNRATEKRHLAWPHLFEDPMITKKQPKTRPLGERI